MKMHSGRMLLLGVIVVLGVGSGIGWHIWRTSPKWSVLQIQKAVKNHDVETFEKHVDIEGIIIRALPTLTELSGSKANDLFDSPEVSQMLTTAMQGPLVNSGREIIRGYVEKGTMDLGGLSKLAPRNPGAISSPPWAPRPSARLVDVSKSGKMARARLEWTIPAYDGSVQIGLIMRRVGSIWQISEVEDPVAIVKEVAALGDSYPSRNLLGTTCTLLRRYAGGYEQRRLNVLLFEQLVTAGKIDEAAWIAYDLARSGDTGGIYTVAPRMKPNQLAGILEDWVDEPERLQVCSYLFSQLARSEDEGRAVELVLRAPGEIRPGYAAAIVDGLLAANKPARALEVAEQLGLDKPIEALVLVGRTDEAWTAAEAQLRSSGGRWAPGFSEVVKHTGDLAAARALRDRLNGDLRVAAGRAMAAVRGSTEGVAAAIEELRAVGAESTMDDISWSIADECFESGRDSMAVTWIREMAQERRGGVAGQYALGLIQEGKLERAKCYVRLSGKSEFDSESDVLWDLALVGLDTMDDGEWNRIVDASGVAAYLGQDVAMMRTFRSGGLDAVFAESKTASPLRSGRLAYRLSGLEAVSGNTDRAMELARALGRHGYSRRGENYMLDCAMLGIAIQSLVKGVPREEQSRLAGLIMRTVG